MTFSDAADIEEVARGGEVIAPPVERSTSAWSAAQLLGTSLAVSLFAAVAFSLWQIKGAVVPWDSKNHFYPMFRFLGDALRHGTIPLWNPYHFGGYPAVADPQSLIFTPSMMLFALLAPHASMQVFDAIIFGHLTAGAFGVLGLSRRWRWHPVAAVLAALVFAFGGTAASRLQHTGMIISYSWFPLAFWSLLAALDHRSKRRAVLAGILAALMALGRDQVAYLLCVTLVGFVACEVLEQDRRLAYLRTRAMTMVCAGLTTVLCTSMPILLTMQFLHGSNRPGIPFGMALEGSLDPVNLLTLIAPNVFGSLDTVYDYWGPGAATIAGNDWTDRTIDYLFVGTLPLVLFLWHGLAAGRVLTKGVRAFALLSAAALVYALGRHTGAFQLIFDWLPGVSLYRRPADATFLLTLALAFCSGALLDRYVGFGLPRKHPTPLAFATATATLLAVAFVVGLGLSFVTPTGHLAASSIALAASFALTLVIAVALALADRRRRTREVMAAVLVAATAGQLLWRNCASPLNAEPAQAYSAYAGLPPAEAGGLAILRQELAASTTATDRPRVEILGLNGSWQNASMVFGLEDTIGYNPLRIADYERAVGVGESANDPKLRIFPDTFRGYNSRLSSLLGLGYLMLDRPLGDLPRQMPRPRATLLFSSDDVYLYRLQPHAAPRVYVATSLIATEDPVARDATALPPFDPAYQAIVRRFDLQRLSPSLRARTFAAGNSPSQAAASSTRSSTAAITDYGDNRVAISVDAAQEGLLVLHDIFYPGWIALIDGRPAPILRTNLLFRGVEVAPGHHTVEFSFHPFSLENLKAAASTLLVRDRS